MPIRWHADDGDLLLQAIELTARETGFNPRLIEKDYFCSVVLEYLAASDMSEVEFTREAGTLPLHWRLLLRFLSPVLWAVTSTASGADMPLGCHFEGE